MSEFLQQLFDFYLRGGWLWMALVPLLLLIFMLIDNQRRQRQALTWILFLGGCLIVFAPSLFYSLSGGTALTQSTREIFYAGVVGVMGAILGIIGYVVSFQWRIAQPGSGFVYPGTPDGMNGASVLPSTPDYHTTELTDNYGPQSVSILTVPDTGMNPERPPQALFDSQTRPFEPTPAVRPQKDISPGWLQDHTGQRYPLYLGVTQIGREADQDIRPGDGSVSRRHAIIRYERYAKGDAFIFQAVGQAETALNDVIIGRDPKQLYDGDRIRLGTVTYTFFIQARR